MNKRIMKDALTLFAITFIAGILLGGVYEITKKPIIEQNEIRKEEACKTVFSSASSFQMDEQVNLKEADEFLTSKGYNVSIDETLEAVDANGNHLGYVITVISHEGYGGDIKFSIGIQKDGTVNAISFLSINETAGLGMKAPKDKFKSQFDNKNVTAFAYTKTSATGPEQIDAISGATITTNAVTNAVNAGIDYAKVLEGSNAVE